MQQVGSKLSRRFTSVHRVLVSNLMPVQLSAVFWINADNCPAPTQGSPNTALTVQTHAIKHTSLLVDTHSFYLPVAKWTTSEHVHNSPEACTGTLQLVTACSLVHTLCPYDCGSLDCLTESRCVQQWGSRWCCSKKPLPAISKARALSVKCLGVGMQTPQSEQDQSGARSAMLQAKSMTLCVYCQDVCLEVCPAHLF